MVRLISLWSYVHTQIRDGIKLKCSQSSVAIYELDMVVIVASLPHSNELKLVRRHFMFLPPKKDYYAVDVTVFFFLGVL